MTMEGKERCSNDTGGGGGGGGGGDIVRMVAYMHQSFTTNKLEVWK